MSDLSEALNNLPVHTEDIDPAVFKAARRWDALTEPETIEKGARKEWEANLELERLVVPSGWDRDLWLDYMAARTVFIAREWLRAVTEEQQ